MKYHNKQGFSLIEILISIMIFTLGVISVYAILDSVIRSNTYNRNYIIAVNLAKEQLELVRNIRDSNYQKIRAYNQLNPNEDYDAKNVFATGSYYTIENNWKPNKFPVAVTELLNFPKSDEKQSIVTAKIGKVYKTTQGEYVLEESGNTKTPFYKYIQVSEVPGKERALLITSRVVWFQRGYHDFELKTILTDYKIY